MADLKWHSNPETCVQSMDENISAQCVIEAVELLPVSEYYIDKQNQRGIREQSEDETLRTAWHSIGRPHPYSIKVPSPPSLHPNEEERVLSFEMKMGEITLRSSDGNTFQHRTSKVRRARDFLKAVIH